MSDAIFLPISFDISGKPVRVVINADIAKQIYELGYLAVEAEHTAAAAKADPPATDGAGGQAAVAALVEGMKASTGTMHGMAIGALAAIRRGKVPGVCDPRHVSSLYDQAQTQIATLRAENEKLTRRIQLFKDECVFVHKERDAKHLAVCDLTRERDRALAELAEAKAHKVVVKLPDYAKPTPGWIGLLPSDQMAWNKAVAHCADAIRAAGVEVAS